MTDAAKSKASKCGHVPAVPDVDLTICWMCGVEIVADPVTHLWRPLTAAERLVKFETIRKCRALFFATPYAEFSQILLDRLEGKDAPVRLDEGIMGRWFIVHGHQDDLAWSGTRWVPHRNGLPTSEAQVCNFGTPEEAEEYIKEHFSTRVAQT